MDLHNIAPKLYCPSVADIKFSTLAFQGIVNYCFDIDNTLASRTDEHPLPKLAAAIERARKAGYIRGLCVVSNIIFGEARRQRVINFARDLNTPHYYAANFWERKPSPKPFLAAMKMLHSDPTNTAFVGDQLFTDIIGGNRLGMYTILVQPIGPDHWCTRLTGRRKKEQIFLQRLGLSDFRDPNDFNEDNKREI